MENIDIDMYLAEQGFRPSNQEVDVQAMDEEHKQLMDKLLSGESGDNPGGLSLFRDFVFPSWGY